MPKAVQSGYEFVTKLSEESSVSKELLAGSFGEGATIEVDAAPNGEGLVFAREDKKAASKK